MYDPPILEDFPRTLRIERERIFANAWLRTPIKLDRQLSEESADTLNLFHSSASASQYSISFLARAAFSRLIISKAANWAAESMRFPKVMLKSNLLPMVANLQFRNAIAN
jgi:hypothetical protein